MKIRKSFLAVATILSICFLVATVIQAQSQKTIVLKRKIKTYGCISGANPNNSEIKLTNSTGQRDIDIAVGIEISELNKQFTVFVPVYFEISDVKNAYFTNEKFSELIMADTGKSDQPYTGSVILAHGLWNDEMVKNAGFALPALIAHEFAHAMQYKKNFPYEGKWLELHADFLAGWFTGHRGRFTFQNDNLIMNSFFDKGDFAFFSRNHHGTPQERANAFYSGYALNKQYNVAFGTHAYDYGIQYLKSCKQLKLCL